MEAQNNEKTRERNNNNKNTNNVEAHTQFSVLCCDWLQYSVYVQHIQGDASPPFISIHFDDDFVGELSLAGVTWDDSHRFFVITLVRATHTYQKRYTNRLRATGIPNFRKEFFFTPFDPNLLSAIFLAHSRTYFSGKNYYIHIQFEK